MDIFVHLFVLRIVKFVWKNESKRKRGRYDPFLKKHPWTTNEVKRFQYDFIRHDDTLVTAAEKETNSDNDGANLWHETARKAFELENGATGNDVIITLLDSSSSKERHERVHGVRCLPSTNKIIHRCCFAANSKCGFKTKTFHFMANTNLLIVTVNQGNWCLSIKLRLECFVIVT